MRLILALALCIGTTAYAGTKELEVINKAHAQAQQKPHSSSYVNAAMVYDWEPNLIYQVYAAPNRITSIQLEEGEVLLSKAAGDTTRWIVADTVAGSGEQQQQLIYVKPIKADIHTNLLLSTNKRVYNLELHASEQGYMTAVSWNYPKSLLQLNSAAYEKQPLDNLRKERLNFNYAFITQAQPAWMPLRVFDDGFKTFIQFPQMMSVTEAPALFSLSDTGESALINYRSTEDFFIVDRLLDLAQLKIGEHKVSIEKLE